MTSRGNVAIREGDLPRARRRFGIEISQSRCPMADTPTKPPTSGFSVRPRFEQLVDLSEAEARAQIEAAFAREPDTFEVRSMSEFVVIHMADQLRRKWSPRLQISLAAESGSRTRITGVYGPAHEVWATFIFGYMMTGSIALFSGIYGGVQVFLGDEPWALWMTGSVLVVAGILYLLAQLGQKLGAWQTFQLHQAYRTAMDHPMTRPDVDPGASI